MTEAQNANLDPEHCRRRMKVVRSGTPVGKIKVKTRLKRATRVASHDDDEAMGAVRSFGDDER